MFSTATYEKAASGGSTRYINVSDIFAVKLDLDAKTLSFCKNGALLKGKPAITEVALSMYRLRSCGMKFKDQWHEVKSIDVAGNRVRHILELGVKRRNFGIVRMG